MNPMDFFAKHEGKHVRIYMRRDISSGSMPEFIDGELIYFDIRTGLIILNTENSHLIFVNRGAISYVQIERLKHVKIDKGGNL
jgi:hypothetical protein